MIETSPVRRPHVFPKGPFRGLNTRPPALCRATHFLIVRTETPKASATSAAVCPAATRATICSRL